jgi:hypothetical protein
MSKVNGANLQIGDSGTASQNCTLTANGDGTFTLARGNIGATSQDLLTIDASGVIELTQRDQIKSGTVINTTSGTFHDYLAIPSWVKKITLMFNIISTNGASIPIVQLGDAGGMENTGYDSDGSNISTGVNTTHQTTGFSTCGSWGAGNAMSGLMTIANMGGNAWIMSGSTNYDGGGQMHTFAGVKTLSATLDRLRLTTVNGTDLFDAGSINILMEG